MMELMSYIDKSNFDASMKIFKLLLQNGVNVKFVNQHERDIWYYINRIRNVDLREPV